MRPFLLVGFVLLAILVLIFIDQKAKERFNLPIAFNPITMLNTRLSKIEGRIKESDTERAKNTGRINSTYR
jgi:hypothetical protein